MNKNRKAKLEAAGCVVTDAAEWLGLEPGERQFTKAEARAAAEKWMTETTKHPGYDAAMRRVMAQQAAAKALRRMRERAALTQSEIARRMDVKATAVSRLERFGATTLQALFGYANACGYKISITAKSKKDKFALA